MRVRVFAFSLLLAAVPAAAQAESSAPAPSCNIGVRPRDGATIPANAPVPFALSWSNTKPRAITLTTVTPATSFTAKPGGGNDTWYVPDAALAENTDYTIAWAVDCPVAFDAGTPKSPTETTFRTSTNVDLPTTIGTATATDLVDEVRVDVTPSTELAAYLALTTFELGVGDEKPSSIGSGSGSAAKVSFTVAAYRACGSLRSVDIDQSITIGASILGASQKPTPVTVMGHFRCTQLPTYPNSSSSSSTGSTSGGPSASDAGPDDPGATNADNVGGEGCAQTPEGAGVSFGPFVLAILGVGLVRHRKRRA